MYLSTDYWEKPIHNDELVASGASNNEALPWDIFTPATIGNLISIANKHGFDNLGSGVEIPACDEQPVYWQGLNYTFIAIEFQKTRRPHEK